MKFPKETEIEIIQKIVDLLNTGKFTQGEIAETVGVSRKYVCQIKKRLENGELKQESERNLRGLQLNNITNDHEVMVRTNLLYNKDILLAAYNFKECAEMLFNPKRKHKVEDDIEILQGDKVPVFKFFRKIFNKYGVIHISDSEMRMEMNKANLDPTTRDVIEECMLTPLLDKKPYLEMIQNFVTYEYATEVISKVVDSIRNKEPFTNIQSAVDDYNINVAASMNTTKTADEILLRKEQSRFFPIFIPEINEATKGFATGPNVVCGLTGTGKTMWVVNQEVFLAKQGIPSYHVILGGDNSAEEYLCRILANLSGYDYWKLFKDFDLANKVATDYKDILSLIHIRVETEGVTIENILRQHALTVKMALEERKPAPYFMVVDYDGLIECKGEAFEQADHIYKTAQSYGKEHGVSILFVSQPTKQAESDIRAGNRKMQLTDLEGGKRKGNVASVVIGLSLQKVIKAKTDDSESDLEDIDKSIKPMHMEVLKGRYGGIYTSVNSYLWGNKCKYFNSAEAINNVLNSSISFKNKDIDSFSAEVDDLPW